jgi:hypothetical protein
MLLNRDGCAFDEVSDEGRCTFRQFDILDQGPRSLTLSACTVNVQKLRLWGDEYDDFPMIVRCWTAPIEYWQIPEYF